MALQAMKNRAGTWVIRIFAVLLILSFAVWGVGDMITGQGVPTDVAEVGGTKITAAEFNEQFRRDVNRLRSVLGPELDTDQARQLGIAENTLEGLISRRLLTLEAHDLGLVVGDDQIRRAILQQPAFRNSAGRFDQTVFAQVLAQSGLTEDRYVEGLRSDLTRSHLTGLTAAGGLAPTYLADQLYRYRNEKRVAELVVIARDTFSVPAATSEAELREFHKKNAALFTAPETRDVVAIHLDPLKQAEELRPSDEQLRNEYEDRLSSFSVPERREIRQILVQDEARARQALDRLRAGADFTTVAREIAGQDEAATKLGLVTASELPEELAEVAFKLAAKKPSEPVQTPFGWHILLAETIEPGKTPSFEEVRDRLARDLARELAVDALVQVANRLEDALAGGATLEEAAEQIGVRVIAVKGVDVSGRTVSGAAAVGVPKNTRFLEIAFATEQGETSDLNETADGGYIIVRVDRIEPPELKPFESVRAEVLEAWRQDRQDAMARTRAEKVRDEVKSGTPLAAAAANHGLKVETSAPFTRFGRGEGSPVSPALAAELFRAQRGGVAMAPTGAGYAVAQLKDIQPADPSADPEGMRALRNQLAAAMSDDLLAEFTAALRRRHTVSVDRGAMDRLFNETTVSR